MEEKYDPLQAASHVWSKFWPLPEHRNSKIEDYTIFIQIKQSENECYLIRPSKSGYLWKGSASGTQWRLISDEEELYKNRDLLGVVYVKFRNNLVMINAKELEPFPNFNLFWNYITR